MTHSLYMDQHVNAAITSGLRDRGIDVLTAFEDGFDQHDDSEILSRATELNRLVFTQDEDFLAIGHEWQASGREFYGIVYSHQLSITVGRAVQDLQIVCEVLTEEDVRGQVVFLPI